MNRKWKIIIGVLLFTAFARFTFAASGFGFKIDELFEDYHVVTEDEAAMTSKIFEYMKHPKGLTISLGYSYMSAADFFGNRWYEIDDDYGTTNLLNEASDSERYAIFLRAGDIKGIHIGVAMENSFAEVRFSPFWGGATNSTNKDCFYIEAETGAYALNYRGDKDIDLLFRLGLTFYGSMMGFRTPLYYVGGGMVTNYGGLGYVNVGTGIQVIGGLSFQFENPILDTLEITTGFYMRLGAILPNRPTFGIAWVGPDIRLKTSFGLGIYTHFVPIVRRKSYDVNVFEMGLLYEFQ